MKTFVLLLFLAGVCFGQACTIDQGFQCAGNFAGSVAGPSPTGPVCASNTLAGTVPFSTTFTGGYQDFYTAPNGSIVWGSYTASNSPQTMSSNGACYLQCDSGIPINFMGFSCPSSASSTAVPTAGFTGYSYGLTGSLLGAVPYAQDGIPACQSYSVPAIVGIKVTLCAQAYGPQVIGAEMSGPNHCTEVIVTLPPPSCACPGDTAKCSNNVYVCPAAASNVTYEVWELCGPDNTCLCEYLATDYYYCSQYTGSLWELIYEDCYAF